MLNWKYESRRDAQPILPFIFLGPSNIARDVNFVASNGITLLLAVRSASAAKARPSLLNPATFTSAANIETGTFDLDTPYDLITRVRPTIKAMNDHLERSCINQPPISINDVRGKILVFCESGNDRSTVLVAAYIMVVYGVDAITAIQLVQSQRFCVNVDEGMKRMLLDFGEILKAERDVAYSSAEADETLRFIHSQSTNSVNNFKMNRPTKRNIQRAYESDEDMDEDVWTTEYTERTGKAPFEDMSM